MPLGTAVYPATSYLVFNQISFLDYNFSYERIEDWGYIDIAMVKVDTPYDFKTLTSPKCSWIPNAINISYDWRDMDPDKDAMALGWGSTYIWRHVSFNTNVQD